MVPEKWREDYLNFSKDVTVRLLECSANGLDSLKTERLSCRSRNSVTMPGAGGQKKFLETMASEVKKPAEVTIAAPQNKRVKKVSFFDETRFSKADARSMVQRESAVTVHIPQVKKRRVK